MKKAHSAHVPRRADCPGHTPEVGYHTVKETTSAVWKGGRKDKR